MICGESTTSAVVAVSGLVGEGDADRHVVHPPRINDPTVDDPATDRLCTKRRKGASSRRGYRNAKRWRGRPLRRREAKVRAPRSGVRAVARSAGLFATYEPLERTFDEFFGAGGRPHPHAESVVPRLDRLSRAEYRTLQTLADKTFLRSGVTFSVYSGQADPDRIFPFDLIPRIVSGSEWRDLERGLIQRDPGAERVPAGRLRTATHPRRRHRSARAGRDVEVFPARDARRRAAARRARAHRRRGPDPRSRRPFPGTRRQHPHAVRRLVRAREPDDDEEGVPADLR